MNKKVFLRYWVTFIDVVVSGEAKEADEVGGRVHLRKPQTYSGLQRLGQLRPRYRSCSRNSRPQAQDRVDNFSNKIRLG